MKILFVTFGSFLQNATLKRATGMATPLLEMGWEVHLLLRDDPVNRERVAIECPQATIHWLPEFKSAWQERARKQAVADAVGPNVIWICGTGLRNWVKAVSEDCRVLGDASEQLSSFSGNSLPRFFWEAAFEWWQLLVLDGFICASRHLERLFIKRLNWLRRCRPVLYLPYAYSDNSKQAVGAPAMAEAQSRKPFTLLYMGSFWENYGVWDMLQAFKLLHAEGLVFRVLMLGKGPEVDNARAWVQREGLEDYVAIKGFVAEADLPGYLAKADAFLCPLRDTVQDWARCPSKLFLYIPYGKPIVTCKIGEAVELLGEQAIYFKPQDVGSFAAAIQDLMGLQDLSTYRIAPEKHDWRARVDSFQSWLDAAFSGRR